MRGVCCVCCVVLIVIRTWLADAQGIEKEHPECRTTSCRWDESKSDHSTLYYIVNGTMAGKDKLNQQVIIEFLDMDKFFLWCNSHPRQTKYQLSADDPSLPAMARPLKVKTVEIRGCNAPINSSYHEVLTALKVSFFSDDEDTSLNLTELPAEPPLEGRHLEGLPIKTLVITAKHKYPVTRPKFDFLDKMHQLRTLEIKQYVVLDKDALERLPEGLLELTLKNTRLPAAETKLNNGSFWLERLRSLRTLHLVEGLNANEKQTLRLPPLASLPNLTIARLYFVPLNLSFSRNWLNGSKLQTLILMSCGLKTIPDDFFTGANIAHLYLIKNGLSYLPNGLLSPLQSLKELDLTSNNLNGKNLVNSLSSLKNLEILKVNDNPELGSLCGEYSIIQGTQSSQLPKKLRQLELINTGATRICSDWIEMNGFITHLALDNNKIRYLRYSDLMMMRNASIANTKVTVSLLNNPLKRIQFTKRDYERCINATKHDWGNPKPVKVKLELNVLACDCQDGYWLHETLRHCSLLALNDDIRCKQEPPSSERLLRTYKSEDFTCGYNGNCTSGCTCQRRVSDNATVMRCTGALPSDPRWPPSTEKWPLALYVPPGTLTTVPPVNLVELYAPHNNIIKIDENDIPDTLRVLDVRNNSIARITPEAAQKLLDKSENGLQVWISGNPLACVCEDASAIEKLKFAKILDWNTTRCADGSPLRGKTRIEMCESKVMAPLLGVTGTLLIIIVAVLIFLRLLPNIRQFLFDHNMCLDWVLSVKDDPNDPMKTHDVFISYSYHDYVYAKKLIEKLEEHGISTIEHCRDWLPGETVSQQILHSVMSARRTLLLVSDNYANSKWSLEEFHTAHNHAIEHGSARVIVVRCQLLKPHELPQELQQYLYNNTYLHWDDLYFWDKLYRVMPKRRATPSSGIALIANQNSLPSIRIQLTSQKTNAYATPQSRLSVDKDPPLSELVLVPSLLTEDSPRQSSAKTSPVTRQPFNEKNASLPQRIQREGISAPVIPTAVSPCAC